MRLRFAPSPTGYLHVGGARTALFNWLMARQSQGVFILRIEDTDRQRSKPEHVGPILEGLEWLGLDWDEGPIFQADGFERHKADALRLLEAGHAYRDFTPPEEFAAAKEAAVKAGTGSVARLAREMAEQVSFEEREDRAAAGEPHAVRFRVPDGETVWEDLVHGTMRFANDEIDDLVILRSDGTPIYNLAVVSDDADQGITHVVRGDDHLSNTPKQILLYEALGKSVPVFGHVPLILGSDGRRLSKRHGATAIGAYGDLGILPEAMVNFLALLGWSPGTDEEVLALEEIVLRFSIDRVLKKGAVFDHTKLEWLNGQYLAQKTNDELVPLFLDAVEAAGLPAPGSDDEQLDHMVGALKMRARSIADMATQARPYLVDAIEVEEKAARKHWFKDPESTARILEAARDAIASTEWDAEHLEEALRGAAASLEVGAGKLFQPLRVALTGLGATPGIFDVLLILGPDRSMERIEKAIPMVMRGPTGDASDASV